MRSRTALVATTVGLMSVIGACASNSKAATSVASTTTTLAGVTTAAGIGSSAAAPGTTATTPSGSTVAPVETLVPGDIPDTQVFVVFTPPAGGFSVKVPEGWARSSDGSATVFTDKYNAIRIESMAMATAPTIDSVTQTDLALVQQSAKGFVVGKVSVVQRKAGSAVLATYQIESPPNPVTSKFVRLAVERYEFWRTGHAVIITLSSSVGSDNVDPWRTVTDGFGWV